MSPSPPHNFRMLTGRKLRAYPTDAQAQTLARWIGCQRKIYNSKVGEDRYYRAFKRKFPANVGEKIPVDQEYARFISAETAFLREVPPQVLRNGAYRWRTAYGRFFKGLAGRPTIKQRHGRQSVMLTSELFEIRDGAVSIGTRKCPVGQIDIPGFDIGNKPAPKMLYVSVDAGRWHVSFSLDDETPESSEAEVADWLREQPNLLAMTAGTDLGVAVPLATHDGVLYDFSAAQKRHLEKAEKRKRRHQRIAARRQKGSRRRRRALAAAGRASRYMADIRRDFAHKTSRKIVDDPAIFLIGLDGVKIRNMTKSAKGNVDAPGKNVAQKSGLNRSILSSAWGMTRNFIRYKALREHKLAIEVSPAYGSQECSHCGCINPANRPTRDDFACTSCHFACHADVNAALIARKRAHAAISSSSWAPKERRRVRIRRAGTVRTGDGDIADARGDAMSRDSLRAVAQASPSRETPAKFASVAAN